MSKVPVGASIAHAYEFLFGRFFQIIGTAWVPAALFGVGYYAVLQSIPAGAPAHAPDPAALGAAALGGLAALLAALLLGAVIAVSLTQEALGVRKDLTLAHLVVGPRELRLFFGYLRYLVVYVLFYALLIAVCCGLMFAAKVYGAPLAPKFHLGAASLAVCLAALVSVILAVWYVLSMLRLFFLLGPVAAAEHRTRLSRAWSLTHGSTFRILFVYLGTYLPIAIAAAAALYYVLGPADIAALLKALHDKPGDALPLHDFIVHHAGTLALYAGIMAAVKGAVLAGASAGAYRAVTGHEDPELEDDAALVAPLLEPAEDHHVAPAHEDHGHGHHGHEDHGHSHEAPAEESDDAGSDEGSDDDHGHEDHGHGGHEDHGHGGHGHDDSGHHDHGHDDHEHGGHGHDDGHDDHGHHAHAAPDDHGHGTHAAEPAETHDHAHHGEDTRHVHAAA